MSIQTLLLRLRGGSKGTKRIADLTSEELVVRRETEKINKRKQRARAREITLEEYQKNLGHQQHPIIPERAQPAVRQAAVRAAENFREAQKRKKGKIVEKQQKTARENAYEEYEGFPDVFSKAGLKRTARKRTQAKTQRLGKKLEKATKKLQEENIMEENRQQEYVEAELIKTGMAGVLKDYKIVNYTTTLTPEELLIACQNEIKTVILSNVPSKIIVRLHVTFEKIGPDGVVIQETKYISSKPFAVNNTMSDLSVEWEHILTSLINSMAAFVLGESGWSIKKIHGIHINTSATILEQGHSFVEIPKWLAEKKCVINIQNKDNKCFIYAVDRSLEPKPKNNERVDKDLKKCGDKYNLTGITFPVDKNQFKLFEENNPDIALNVYYLDHDIPFNRTVQPLYPSARTCKKEAVIFLYNEHFLTVTSESRLLSKPKPKNEKEKGGDQHARKFPCRRCCMFFRTPEKLETHKLMCIDQKVARTTFPKPGKNFLKFRNGRNVLEAPLVIYADGESIMKVLNRKMNGTVTQLCQHTPSGFGFECVYSNGHHEYHEILGEHSAKGFVNALYDVVHNYYHKTVKNIVLEGWELQKANADLKTALACKICKHLLVRNPKHEMYSIHRPVKFSDGYTGEFLGIAHHDCEAMAKHTKKIPVLFHNLAGYDLKMFIRELGSANPFECGAIDIIAKTQEDIIQLQKKVCVDNVEGFKKKKDPNEKEKFVWQKAFKDVNYILSFQDSLKHLPSSLENLASTLRPDQFKITRASVNNDEEKFKLICRKGVYPYNYMDSFEKLNETELPPKSAFYNILKETDILDKEYEHAQNVWKTFGCKTMWEYHNLYLRTDVSLLADVFEAYRVLSMETFELDPVHYITAPSFFWDALLKSSGTIIELISEENSEMYNFFERGIRGGLSMAIQRFSEANNKYMTNYDPTKESTYIINPDKNALYASSESKPLPIGGFGWMNEDKLLCWESLDDKLTEQEDPGISEYLQKALAAGGRWGCTLEVDLHYPQHLHDLHNDLPLAPEPMVAGKGGQQKLIPNFNDKKNYVVYHETLKNYLKLGLKLKKVHCAVKYVEFPWMKDFVEMNAELRKKADLVHDKFKTEYYKLASNAPYGKTMENVRNRMKTDVTQNPLETKYMCSKPTFRDRKILSENLALILRGRTEVKLNKPIFMGQVILDRSKNVMDDFVYEYLYPKWGAENVSLNYIDTDGVICTIKTDDIFADIKDDDAWDTSNFPGPHNATNSKAKPFDLVQHPSGITVRNRKVPGKVKLESGARIIKKVACICAKMYSFVTQLEPGDTGNGTVCKCKGGDRHKVNEFTFGNYERCLFENEVTRIETNRIKSRGWNIYTEKSSKVALRNSDDKRVIDPNDGFTTYARGHWRVLEDVQLILSDRKMFPDSNRKNWPDFTHKALV